MMAEKLVQNRVSKTIVAKIKNTMSDRSSVQKSFNQLLMDYRSSVLPEVLADWQDLSSEEKGVLAKMNNFFCGLHFIVSLAEQSAEALAQWEKLHFSGKVGAAALPFAWEDRSSGIVRLVRTATKTFQKHGDEQAGCIGNFHAFLKASNTKMNISEFKGNQFCYFFFQHCWSLLLA